MKISNEKPPIYDELHEKFGVDWDDHIIITVGETIYTKHPKILRADLIVHEKTHEVQQRKDGPATWWKKWIEDPKFRFEQEKDAYMVQSVWLKQFIPDRNKRAKYVRSMAKNFSSPMYGSMISMQTALYLLR